MTLVEKFLNSDTIKAAIQAGAPLEDIYKEWDQYDILDNQAFKLTQYLRERGIDPLQYFQKTIPSWCFATLKDEKIEIPSGITAIDEYAFSYMPNLEEIILPVTIKSIGGAAFFDLELDLYIYYQGTADQFSAVQTTPDFKRKINAGDIKLICTDMID